MTKILGFDFGTQRIGVAIGQTITQTASPVAIIKAKDGIPNWDEIKTLITEWKPDALIVGLPLNMDGTEQEISTRARKFAKRLQGKFGLPIHLVDERLTSKEAKAHICDPNLALKHKDLKRIDAYAACLIVERFLQSEN